MCGFIQSTFLTVPVKVIGLLESNSAETEWCAASGTVTERTRAVKTASEARDTIDVSSIDSVNVIGDLPNLDRAFENAVEIVLVARILHEHVRGVLHTPRANVHPFLRVHLRIANGHGVLDGSRIGPVERI